MSYKPKSKTNTQDIFKTWKWSRTIYVAIWGLIYGVLLEALFDGQLLNQHIIVQLMFFMIIPLGIGGLSTRMIPASCRNVDIAMYVTLFSTFIFLVFAAFAGLIIYILPMSVVWGSLGMVAYRLCRIGLRLLTKFWMLANNEQQTQA